MTDLEYRIGGLHVNPVLFKGADSNHRFLVSGSDAAVSIYVGCAIFDRGTIYDNLLYRHVFERFKPENFMVGGGKIYSNGKQLVLEGSTLEYGFSLPKRAAKKFGKLLVGALGRSGIPLDEVRVNTNTELICEYWKKYEAQEIINSIGSDITRDKVEEALGDFRKEDFPYLYRELMLRNLKALNQYEHAMQYIKSQAGIDRELPMHIADHHEVKSISGPYESIDKIIKILKDIETDRISLF
jgi:hypothetical protein